MLLEIDEQSFDIVYTLRKRNDHVRLFLSVAP